MVKDKILYHQLKLIHHSIVLDINTFDFKVDSISTHAGLYQQLLLVMPNTELYRKSISYYGVRGYNPLPNDFKTLFPQIFNTRLKKRLLDTYLFD